MADSSHEKSLGEVVGAETGAEEEELSLKWRLGHGNSQGSNFGMYCRTDRVGVRGEEVSVESMGSHVCSCQLCTEGCRGTYGGTSWYVCD